MTDHRPPERGRPRAGRPSATARPAPVRRLSRPAAAEAGRSPAPHRSSTPDEVNAQRQGRRAPTVRTPEPLLPPDVRAEELDRDVLADLRSLPEATAEKVARHLVAAARLVDEDPQRSLLHARFARSRAARVAVVREAAGIAAYRAGEYAEALAELRAVRRMTGRPDHLPVIADCERGLGRPRRATELARDPDVRRLDPAGRAEMRIVESGARRDLGEFEAAVAVLHGPELSSDVVQPWTARVWYAYADAQLAAGRLDEARAWFRAAADVDDDEQTDALERLAELGDEPA